MPLNNVTLTGTLPRAGGALALFTPSNWLTDASDDLLIPPAPEPVSLDSAGHFSADLLATDNTGPLPDGWFWTVAINGIPGVAAETFSFFLPFSGGATQDIADLVPVTAAPVMLAYLPLPSGGPPSAGEVPAAIGDGSQNTAWGAGSGGGGSGTVTGVSVATANGFAGTVANPSTTPAITVKTGVTGLLKGNGTAVSAAVAGTDYDAAGAASAAQTAAQSFATSAVSVETARAEGAEVLLAPLASPALTGTPTAPTKAPLTNSTDLATTAYADAAVGVETARAETSEALALQKAGNLSDLANATTARTNLGLGSAATQSSAAFDAAGAAAAAQAAAQAASLAVASNLSDLASATTARTNLGLGTAATQPSSAFDASGAAATAQANAEAASLPLTGGTMSGAIAMGSHKVTGLTNGSAASDAAAFGQIPTSLAPSGAAGGVLSGTYPSPGFATTPLPQSGGTMTGWLAPAVAALTFGASIALNAALGNVFAVTLTASTGTLANPTNPVDGQAIRVRVTQDGTGSRTLAYGTAYDFGTAGAPTLSTGAGKVDILGFEYVAALSKWCYLGSGLGF